jgi:hypothetical protein
MPKQLTSIEKIARARKLIQQARDVPIPEGSTRFDIAYIGQVKTLLQQARDLVKFIPYQPTATPELKTDVEQIFKDADQANKDILH